jgi:hypothetical protein
LDLQRLVALGSPLPMLAPADVIHRPVHGLHEVEGIEDDLPRGPRRRTWRWVWNCHTSTRCSLTCSCTRLTVQGAPDNEEPAERLVDPARKPGEPAQSQ